MWAFIIGFVAVVLMAVGTLWRVRREWSTQTELTVLTSVMVWLLYALHAGLTLLSAWYSLWPLPLNPLLSFTAGIVLCGLGIALFVAGMISFKSFQRISGIDTDGLITDGIYQYSRNPQNVGWTLFLTGVSLLGRSGLALVLAVLFWLSFRIYLPWEEEFLGRRFGDQYRRYRSKTSRFFGPPRRKPTDDDKAS